MGKQRAKRIILLKYVVCDLLTELPREQLHAEVVTIADHDRALI